MKQDTSDKIESVKRKIDIDSSVPIESTPKKVFVKVEFEQEKDSSLIGNETDRNKKESPLKNEHSKLTSSNDSPKPSTSGQTEKNYEVIPKKTDSVIDLDTSSSSNISEDLFSNVDEECEEPKETICDKVVLDLSVESNQQEIQVSQKSPLTRDNPSETKENRNLIVIIPETPSPVNHLLPSSTSMKLKKKYFLSLTPPRSLAHRKRQILSSYQNTTPKRQKNEVPKTLIPTKIYKVIDLTQNSEDDENDQNSEIQTKELRAKSNENVHPENIVANLKLQVEEKQKILANLKAMKDSNEKTKCLIEQWTEGGIRALEDLSKTRTPEIEIGFILDQLQIPHELFGYNANN